MRHATWIVALLVCACNNDGVPQSCGGAVPPCPAGTSPQCTSSGWVCGDLHCPPSMPSCPSPMCVGGEWVCDNFIIDEGPHLDLAIGCTLDTLNADCAASCGTPDGGLGGTGTPNWPCQSDPWCANGRWRFDCIH